MSEANTGVTGAADIEGVILAAGFSSRTGVFKMELPLEGKTLIEHTIHSMVDFCSRVIVVGGHKSERIIEITKNYANVQVVLNPHYRTGMFSSAREGVRHVRRNGALRPLHRPQAMRGLQREGRGVARKGGRLKGFTQAEK